jgi:S-adenosylmethionine decarboxylase
MFPERQSGPHKDWANEVAFLDNIFSNGAAYTVGKVNGDHWLLYIAGPQGTGNISPDLSVTSPDSPQDDCPVIQDYTIEILMSGLSPAAREPFLSPPLLDGPSSHAQDVSAAIGITDIFPPGVTTLDAYSFTPCGYSSNALISHSDSDPSSICKGSSTEGYYTIHVTPEEGWSYASFECNVPLPTFSDNADPDAIPDLKTLIQRVVRVFQPSRLTLTLFISSEDNDTGEETAVEAAQRAFRAALVPPKANGVNGAGTCQTRYRRTDKINYEFGSYDLAFASYELV